MTVGKHVPAIMRWLRHMADVIHPVIVASNVAGVTGGAIAAAGLLTNRVLQARPGGHTKGAASARLISP